MLGSLNFPSLLCFLPFWGIAPHARPENRSAATQRKASSTNTSVNKTKIKMDPNTDGATSVPKEKKEKKEKKKRICIVCHVCHGKFTSLVDFTIHMELRHGI